MVNLKWWAWHLRYRWPNDASWVRSLQSMADDVHSAQIWPHSQWWRGDGWLREDVKDNNESARSFNTDHYWYFNPWSAVWGQTETPEAISNTNHSIMLLNKHTWISWFQRRLNGGKMWHNTLMQGGGKECPRRSAVKRKSVQNSSGAFYITHGFDKLRSERFSLREEELILTKRLLYLRYSLNQEERRGARYDNAWDLWHRWYSNNLLIGMQR